MRNGLLQGLLKNKENKLAKILNSSLHYVEDVTCLLLMKIKTQLFDKLDDFNFPIVNFPFISSNIPAAPAYGVYMLQLIRYSMACAHDSGFVNIVQLLIQRIFKHSHG